MADCYPPDFTGPLPPGGYYCTPNTPTIFGSINSFLQQGAQTAQQIRATLNTYQGKSVAPPAVQPSTAGKSIGLLLLAVLAALVIYFVWKEL
jgi:hypothetical protein